MKYVVVLGDGMADEPIRELNGRTPLAYAKTPALDKLSKKSEIGMVSTIPEGMKPGSDTANLSVIGYDTPVVYDTQEGGPAYEAGLRKGDVIKSINGHDIHMYKEFRAYILFEGSEHTSFEIVYERDGVEHTTYVTPVDNGSGAYQILLSGGEYEKTDFFGVLKYSFYEVKYWITTTIQSLGMLVQGQVTADDVSGPVGIVSMIGETYQAAREYGALDVALNLANISILLSANLGVMNLLPIPALDGGRLVFLLLEAIRRKPVSREKEGMVHTVGLMLLMALMVFIMFNDVRKLF